LLKESKSRILEPVQKLIGKKRLSRCNKFAEEMKETIGHIGKEVKLRDTKRPTL